MWLFIEPLDVWMFRDGKPFSAGSNHAAQSLFPPPAFTVQGALRTLYLDHTPGAWAAFTQGGMTAIGQGDALGDFTMRGPYLAKADAALGEVERLFPIPADIVLTEDGGLQPLTYTQQWLDASVSDLDGYTPLNVKLDDDNPEGRYWLPESVFCGQYLHGSTPNVNRYIPQDDLFVYEYRYGTALDYTARTVRSDEGMLYATRSVRVYQDQKWRVGILVELPTSTPLETVFPKDGTVVYTRFGGEGHSARLTRLASKQLKRTPPPNIPANKKCKIIFVTPTYFEGGYRPSQTVGAAFNAQVFSAALRRPLPLGGWDLVNQRPRPIRRYLAAGSVFYLNQNDAFVAPLCDQPADGPPLAALGFGDYFIGLPHPDGA